MSDWQKERARLVAYIEWCEATALRDTAQAKSHRATATAARHSAVAHDADARAQRALSLAGLGDAATAAERASTSDGYAAADRKRARQYVEMAASSADGAAEMRVEAARARRQLDERDHEEAQWGAIRATRESAR